MMPHVKRTLDVLCAYYSDRDGHPRTLNAVQVTVYADALAKFSPERLESAARDWMKRSKFFPAVSELLELLDPPIDHTVAAQLAWAAVERAVRQVGAYQSIEFEQACIAETVRQVFGSWSHACSYEFDSPGWAQRRQAFMAIFPFVVKQQPEPIVLRGKDSIGYPVLIEQIRGVPEFIEPGDWDEPLAIESPDTKALKEKS